MLTRSRWAAIGAAVAVTLGAGGLGMVAASGDAKPVTVTVEPERVLDTRVNLGLYGPFTDGTPRELKVTGAVSVASGGSKSVVPEGASAVLVNVTTVTPTDPGFLSLRPGGSSGMPSTSTVNFTAGSVEPNATAIDLGPGGTVQIFLRTASPTGSAHVLLDIVGYTIDHHHDDRYYTQGEVEARLAETERATTWAVIGEDGAYLTGSLNGLRSERLASGYYEITWLDASECAVVATPNSSSVAGLTANVETDTSVMTVSIRDLSGMGVDAVFSLMWRC